MESGGAGRPILPVLKTFAALPYQAASTQEWRKREMGRRAGREEFGVRWARSLHCFRTVAVFLAVLPALLAGSAAGGEPTAVGETAPPPGAPLPADEAGLGMLERVLPQMFFEFELLDIALWQWIALLALALVTAIAS